MMPRKIVLASDLTARSDRAMERALMLASAWDAKLFVVHAIEPSNHASDIPSWRDPVDVRALARARLRMDLGAHAEHAEVIVERGRAASVLLDVVEELGADLIISGVARDEFMGSARLGNTVETLARRSPVPLLVIKARDYGPYRNVIVASEFSEASRAALVTALELYPDARMTLFHALQIPYESYVLDKPGLRESVRMNAVEEAREHLRDTTLAWEGVRILCEFGRPDFLLSDLARSSGFDVLVVGRSRGPIAAFLLGSVSMSLLASVPSDVMVVPPHAAAERARARPAVTSTERRF